MSEADIFSDSAIGKAALRKMGEIPENFRIYKAGWVGGKPEKWQVMKVEGACFRQANSGPRKGQKIIKVKGTERIAYVTKREIGEQLAGA